MIAVLLGRGRGWDPDRPLSEQRSFADHVEFVTGLRERGVVIEVGPLVELAEVSGEDPVGLVLLNVESVAAAGDVLAQDPMVASDVLTVRACAWGGELLSRAG